jgi:plastocyanin
MLNNMPTTAIFVVIFIIGILIMMLPFLVFQTRAAVFAKEIVTKNSYIDIAIDKNNGMNVLNKSYINDTNKINNNISLSNISNKSTPILSHENNNEINKNMSLSKNTTTYSQVNKNNNNISLQTTPFENHTTSSLPSAKTVLIVKGAALLRDKAYSPNPIIIHAQDSVNWKNMDDVVHTVTSGSNFSSPNRGQEFDSGLLGGSYTHKFMKHGIYNYFCQIHPTMVGKIIVK